MLLTLACLITILLYPVKENGSVNRKILRHVINNSRKLKTIMATIQELSAKVDELQVSLDAEQEAIEAAIADLNQSIADLQVLIVSGGTEEERQALLDKLNAVKEDLEGTLP